MSGSDLDKRPPSHSGAFRKQLVAHLEASFFFMAAAQDCLFPDSGGHRVRHTPLPFKQTEKNNKNHNIGYTILCKLAAI